MSVVARARKCFLFDFFCVLRRCSARCPTDPGRWKNLREDQFAVTCVCQNSSIGGLWLRAGAPGIIPATPSALFDLPQLKTIVLHAGRHNKQDLDSKWSQLTKLEGVSIEVGSGFQGKLRQNFINQLPSLMFFRFRCPLGGGTAPIIGTRTNLRTYILTAPQCGGSLDVQNLHDQDELQAFAVDDTDVSFDVSTLFNVQNKFVSHAKLQTVVLARSPLTGSLTPTTDGRLSPLFPALKQMKLVNLADVSGELNRVVLSPSVTSLEIGDMPKLGGYFDSAWLTKLTNLKHLVLRSLPLVTGSIYYGSVA